MLLCDTQNSTQAVYRAQVFNFGSISSAQIVSWIEDWVLNGASVTSGPILVTFDSTCPVPLNSFNNEICQLPMTMSISIHTTSQSTPLTSMPTIVSTQSTSSLGVIIGSVLAVGCIVFICVVVIIIAAFHFRLKLKKERYDMIHVFYFILFMLMLHILMICYLHYPFFNMNLMKLYCCKIFSVWKIRYINN